MNKEEKNINNNFNESQLPKERRLTVYERDKEEKKYSFANKNNKEEILESRTPSQNDLEKFEEWKVKKRKNTSNQIGIFILGVIICVSGIIAFSMYSRLWYIWPLLIYTPVGCWALYYTIKEYIDIPSWKIEYCNYARVVDKYNVRIKKHIITRKSEITNYLTILINEKYIQYVDDFNYSNVIIGEEVMLFSVKGKNTVYFCKK